MCGIVGLYQHGEDRATVTEWLDRMCRAIVHRGPDDQGLFVADQVGLGMRRLSIIDVGGGHQPIHNEDETVTVVFNGEIYNFRELREDLGRRGHRFKTRTDTEVIVHAYEEYGPDCVKHFNGIFAFAVWDAVRERLFLARDRMGVKPLYYWQEGARLVFASEVKALLTLPDVDRVLDMEAAAQFFRLGFVPSPRTLFRNIRKLPAGWWLIAEGGSIQLQRYWDLDFTTQDPSLGFEECAAQLRATLQNAVADQMISDVPLGAFLSGGVDSTAVVSFMKGATASEIMTFSIGFDERHAYHNEAPFAEAAAKALGTKHHTLIVHPQVAELLPQLVEKLDEPLTDTSFILSYLVSELARRHVMVALSGLGGDELFGGYRRYLAPHIRRMVSWIPQSVRHVLGRELEQRLKADRGTVLGNFGRYGKALGRTLHLSMGEQYLGLLAVLPAEQVFSLLSGNRAAGDSGAELVTLYDRAPALDPLDRMAYVDAKTVLPESLLLLSDKMGMAASLEVRVPFLDNNVVDFVQRVPSRHRVKGFALKHLLKTAVKGHVPDFVLARSKRGFGTPMSAWIRQELHPLVMDLLDPDRLRRQGVLNAESVHGLISAHNQGREDGTEAIMALMMFELWRDRFKVRMA